MSKKILPHKLSDSFGRVRATQKILAALAALFLALVPCRAQLKSDVAHANSPQALQSARITGQWIIEAETEASGHLRITLSRMSESGGSHVSSFDISLEELRGLARAQVESAGAPVQFKIRRDAGTFNCEGRFNIGSGSGSFTFAPSPIYLTEMRKLGYGEFSDEEMYALAAHDVSLMFAGQLSALGYERMGARQFVALRVHGVTADFIIALKSLGYDSVTPDDLVAMRIHNVTPDFVAELQSLGYFRVPVRQLIAMRIHGVSVSFIEEMRERGYGNLSVEQLINMKIHGLG